MALSWTGLGVPAATAASWGLDMLLGSTTTNVLSAPAPMRPPNSLLLLTSW